ncbi:efflux RND transporter periplasmic adaptor subunit [Sedimentimonas flavescens]|uniref:efflux RND transporter periplasmic adaptor subunit n=1 Tax=Sedimentimonas flavescens TaxID=2851012 RepID=UPI0021A9062E|nr:HlyD family efflux transporter periplasmic adaptor subunit [Sedimentimonas flavescens]MCT2539931.1 HlyD family efflux transporter periplasmic adaptor subunit [Sedimentimonas flavescens]
MRFLTRSLMGLFLLALTLGLLATAGFTVKSAIDARGQKGAFPGATRERVFAANVIALDFTTLTPELTAYGEVRSIRRLELRASAAGTVAELAPNFEEGAQVSAGELLVRLDPAETLAARDSAAASLAEAQAALALAERTLVIAGDDLAAAVRQADLRRAARERQAEIDARGIGRAVDTEIAEIALSAAEQAVLNKRSALSGAEAGLDQARNSLRRAEIALAEAERKLAETEIRAEFDGQLAGVTAVQGGLVSNNEKLAELIDPSALEVVFRVSNAQYARLTEASGALIPAPVRVRLDLQGVPLEARATLVRVGAEVEAGMAGRLLFARIEDGAGLRAGDFVTVSLSEPVLENVALVPAPAVDANSRVLVLGPDERLSEADVTVLRRQGDAVIIRAATLASGQEIVAERTPLLGSGLKLRPLRPNQGQVQLPQTITLDPERRARLIAFVEGNTRMAADTKTRILAQLQQEAVPLEVVERLESRIGG